MLRIKKRYNSDYNQERDEIVITASDQYNSLEVKIDINDIKKLVKAIEYLTSDDAPDSAEISIPTLRD
jgi:hypothetical protein